MSEPTLSDEAAREVTNPASPLQSTDLTAEPASPSGASPASSVIILRASEIVPENIDWLWPGFIARGRLTGLAGYPGLGKSHVAIDLAARVSTGREFPGGGSNGNPRRVIILSAEDRPADTIVPRLIAAGADRDRIDIVQAVKHADGERPFDLSGDLDRLESEHDLARFGLMLLDPITAYVTGVNRNNAGDVRTALHRLDNFAARHGLPILGLYHLNKSSSGRAITRIAGSSEWVAVPRAVFLVTEIADTDRRLFVPLKNNHGVDRVGYSFRIESRSVAGGIVTSAVAWDPEPVTTTADEALAAAVKKAPPGAMDFLRQALGDGPMDQAEIVRLGKEAGFTEKTLRTAREKLGIKSVKEGFGASGKWVWVPATGAAKPTLVVDNEALLDPSTIRDAQTAREPDEQDGAPDGPDDGNTP
jgi:hypothetical protein